MTLARRVRALTCLVVAVATGACITGRDYTRPPVAVPEVFRGQTSTGSASLADAAWWDVFQDTELQTLIRTALERNDDAQLAAVRVLEARAQLGITRSDEFPVASAGAGVVGQRVPAALFGSASRSVGAAILQGSASWQPDFWGRYRRATEAARAQLLATEWGRRAVMTTLVSEVADAYFGLRALDRELDVSRRTLDSREESLRLTQVRERGGATSLVDVRQAEQLVYTATGQIATLERTIEQQENFLATLLGGLPAPIVRGRELTDQPHPSEVPAGLPSALLERRPDIQQAEQQLAAANAQVAVAKTSYFPQISLTGSGGFESSALAALFSPANVIWAAAVSAVQPVFTAGRLRSQVELAEARRQEAELLYQRSVRQAFREVSDSLVGYRKLREFREQQQLLLASSQDARRLADIRYQGGATSYLEVLDADTRLFSAELGLAQAQLTELTGLVELYRALGGGWGP